VMTTASNLKSRENEIFRDWKESAKDLQFIADGIVNLDEYFGSPYKLLFVMKEAHDESEIPEDWNLRDGLANGEYESSGKWRNWQVVARWAHDILDARNSLSYEQLEKEYGKTKKEHRKYKKEWLSKIAVINLKKSGGGASTSPSELRGYVEKYGKYARQQIELYTPDLVICCGVGEIVYNLVFKDSHWERTRRGVWWFQPPGVGFKVVSYSHPGYRIKHSLLHYGLVDAVLELMEK